jgi:hypothetical protein
MKILMKYQSIETSKRNAENGYYHTVSQYFQIHSYTSIFVFVFTEEYIFVGIKIFSILILGHFRSTLQNLD